MNFTHYARLEGEGWLEWTAGDVDGRALRKRDPLTVEINNVTLHALKCADGREWDSVNGWRPTKPQNTIPNGDTSRQPEDVIEEQRQMEQPKDDSAERAQAYAMRVWNGQSDALHRGERVARVKRALEGQGLSFDGVKLPQPNNGNTDNGEPWTAADAAPVTMRFER